ncbi:MAG: type I methionyl aminopeptidase [Spirochaetaceae bacterium]|nr:type I methionyl aminopeptidase [Spirochaetaceae bacterium]
MINLKSAEELAGIKKSCRLLNEIFFKVAAAAKVGVTTEQLNHLAESYIKEAGAEPSFKKYGGFPAALCTSVNNVVIHGVPSNYGLKEGDIIGLDLGLAFNGYFSDMARTFAIGKISNDTHNLIKNTKISLNKAIEAITIDGRIKDIAKAVSNYLKPLGYGVVHEYCGHGVGLAVHEEPEITNDYKKFRGSNPRFRNGMVLAIEPMVNLGTGDVFVANDKWSVCTADGKLSAHFEDTIAIIDGRVEVLTSGA